MNLSNKAMIVWVISCTVFHTVIYLNGFNGLEYDTLSVVLFLSSMVIGSLAFLVLILELFSNRKNEKNKKEANNLILLTIILFVLFFIPFGYMPYTENVAKSEQPIVQQSTDIECFIDGISVMTTRENCMELSKRKPSPAPVQVIQQRRIEIPDPPKIKMPTRTSCQAKHDILGNYTGTDCTTY